MPDKKNWNLSQTHPTEPTKRHAEKKFVSCVHELLSCYNKLVCPANKIIFCCKKNLSHVHKIHLVPTILCTRGTISCAQFFSACPFVGSVASSMHNSWLMEIQINWNVGQCASWWSPCQIQVAPSAQRRKVWLAPTAPMPCSNAAKRRNPLKLAGMPQTNARGLKFTIL